MPPVIHWFRRDLRISDNTALLEASKNGPVIPVYILSSWKKNHAWTGPNRQHFLCESLRALSKNLETIDGALVIREGEAISTLIELAKQAGATAIYYNQDPDPFGKKVEADLAEKCIESGIEAHGFLDAVLHGSTEVLTQSETPYKVFSPYFRNWINLEKNPPLPKPKSLNSPSDLETGKLPTVSHWDLEVPETDLPEAGEKAARDRMKNAVSGLIQEYGDKRDIPSAEGTSRVSQDLRFGLVSIRTLFHQANEAMKTARGGPRESVEIYIKELAWRDFYFAIIHHFPHVLDHEFNKDWNDLPWEGTDENFEKWKNGQTGFPIIDAGMRQLRESGFMHNRVRMITAMFLTKDLHIDWKRGESHFMQHLTDGEIASNNGGWQWSAGTGADAAPYFRIQNPWTQTARHDPKGLYIKKWVPELKDVEPKLFQSPPKDGNPIADNYPVPCVNHKEERDRTLATFKKHRQ